MISSTRDSLRAAWHPIATRMDVPIGHLHVSLLFGEEVVVWRDRTDKLHVWEDRCPHRSVRLSIGRHLGDGMQCIYHGWEFSGGGRCRFVPAHPDDPAPAIGVRSYDHIERDGLIWATLSESKPTPPSLLPRQSTVTDRARLVLRPIVVNAGAAMVCAALKDDRGPFGAALDLSENDLRCVFGSATAEHGDKLALAIRPADDNRSVIYGVLAADNPIPERLAALRHHNDHLSALRDRIEAV